MNNDEKVQLAIENNMSLYKAIFEANGISLSVADGTYFSKVDVPPLYSNLVTRVMGWKPDNVFHEIDRNYKNDGWSEWSIKDSFSCLDLSLYGFKKLFDAHWFYLKFSERNLLSTENRTVFEKVNSIEGIDEWIAIWGEGHYTGKRIFNGQLLDDPNFSLLIGSQNNLPKYVAALNQTNENIGISIFFVKEKEEEVWSDLLRYIYESYGELDVVGYEGQETIQNISQLGAKPTGNLSVWLKANN